MTLDILLATYNGASYLESQIYSIIAQTFKSWRLLIHDDGSNDGTIAKLKKFESIDPRISILEDNISFGSAAFNFLHLLKYSTSDLIIFCDQDDIWFDNKLALLVKEFENVSTPLAVFCNGYTFSSDIDHIGNTITTIFPKNLQEQLFLNGGIQGCSLMFNKQLKDKLKKIPTTIAMHDHFITLGAICFGTLKYLPRFLMLYRQFHANKVTSNIETSKSKRFRSIFISDIPVVDKKHFEATVAFYEEYYSLLNDEQRALFQAYFSFCNQSTTFLEKIIIIIKYRFKLYGKVYPLLLKTITRKTIN